MVVVMSHEFEWLKVSEDAFWLNVRQVREKADLVCEHVGMDDGASAKMWSVGEDGSPIFCRLDSLTCFGQRHVTYWIHSRRLSDLAFMVAVVNRYPEVVGVALC